MVIKASHSTFGGGEWEKSVSRLNHPQRTSPILSTSISRTNALAQLPLPVPAPVCLWVGPRVPQ